MLASAASAPLGFYWAVSQREAGTPGGYALCTTEKAGCTELLTYSRWLSLSTDEFCKYKAFHIHEDACPGGGNMSPYTATHDQGLDVFQLKDPAGPFQRGMPACLKSNAECPATLPTMVVVRGPWERLVSGFVDKFHEVGQNSTRFKQQFMDAFSLDSSVAPFTRFLTGIVDTPSDDQLNDHWRPQAAGCLRFGRTWDLAVDLGDEPSLDTLALAMGATSTAHNNFSGVMAGQYEPSRKKSDWCWEDCASAGSHLIKKVQARYAADVEAIRAAGLKDYDASFDAAVHTCKREGRLCHGDSQPRETTTRLIDRFFISINQSATSAKHTLNPNVLEPGP